MEIPFLFGILEILFGAGVSPVALQEAYKALSTLVNVTCTIPSVLCFSIYTRMAPRQILQGILHHVGKALPYSNGVLKNT